MEGLDYITNEKGEKKALVINLDKYGEYIEDIEDMLVALDRKNEPRVSFEDVEARYQKRKNT
ncbi:MAG: hypothetical protein K9G67_10190 [Bacteroidales bacterium]|nr:hypothetical protein [Bacteroidales bacterium]MCF8343076.1 hypothetical protein [Bacteroidales bacterium]MCF8349971.1 hypothetical protein [Bacteroidales bacterium]MCF8376713.1 hypothetical protein [Bacteroidales bacterium]